MAKGDSHFYALQVGGQHLAAADLADRRDLVFVVSYLILFVCGSIVLADHYTSGLGRRWVSIGMQKRSAGETLVSASA